MLTLPGRRPASVGVYNDSENTGGAENLAKVVRRQRNRCDGFPFHSVTQRRLFAFTVSVTAPRLQ